MCFGVLQRMRIISARFCYSCPNDQLTHKICISKRKFTCATLFQITFASVDEWKGSHFGVNINLAWSTHIWWLHRQHLISPCMKTIMFVQCKRAAVALCTRFSFCLFAQKYEWRKKKNNKNKTISLLRWFSILELNRLHLHVIYFYWGKMWIPKWYKQQRQQQPRMRGNKLDPVNPIQFDEFH